MRPVTDAQVKVLMNELTQHGLLGRAAMKAGMDRTTARKYREMGRMPSQNKRARDWRTRPDPLVDVWPRAEQMLALTPELEVRALFEFLLTQPEGAGLGPKQLRSFQRRVHAWRAACGPPRPVVFRQDHRPGEAMQLDWTWATELEVTIAGEAFPHLLCHPMLPFSNWEWVSVCQSESVLACRKGLQAALFELGRVPTWLQIDHSSAATHRVGKGTDKREFNEDFEKMVTHFGMKPRTIAVGAKEQNGDVESSHRVLKQRLKQFLLLRGSHDFESVEAYEQWLTEIMRKLNLSRGAKVAEELAAMGTLQASRLAEYEELTLPVTRESLVAVKRNRYSVPSRLIGQRVRVRVYEDHIEVYFEGKLELSAPRMLGRFGHRVDYRHIIWSLVRKPGAFARCRYREELFPSLTFRKLHDALHAALNSTREADLEYVRVLYLAATTTEIEVEAAIDRLFQKGDLPRFDAVKAAFGPSPTKLPDMPEMSVDLGEYDILLEEMR